MPPQSTRPATGKETGHGDRHTILPPGGASPGWDGCVEMGSANAHGNIVTGSRLYLATTTWHPHCAPVERIFSGQEGTMRLTLDD